MSDSLVNSFLLPENTSPPGFYKRRDLSITLNILESGMYQNTGFTTLADLVQLTRCQTTHSVRGPSNKHRILLTTYICKIHATPRAGTPDRAFRCTFQKAISRDTGTVPLSKATSFMQSSTTKAAFEELKVDLDWSWAWYFR